VLSEFRQGQVKQNNVRNLPPGRPYGSSAVAGHNHVLACALTDARAFAKRKYRCPRPQILTSRGTALISLAFKVPRLGPRKVLKRLNQRDRREWQSQRNVSFLDCSWKSLFLWREEVIRDGPPMGYRSVCLIAWWSRRHLWKLLAAPCAMIWLMARTGGYYPLLTTITVHYGLPIVRGGVIA